MRYPFKDVEPRWQRWWEEQGIYRSVEDPAKPKFYALDMFPYPSGSGLHIGHPEGYTATDIVSRYKRMCGHSVLHPMGFDAFGLPTERQAMVENIHPAIITERNVATFTRQLKRLGFDYDWSRMVNTTDADYVKWTQWIFLKIYDSWYDAEQERARPMSELPIPDTISDPVDIQRFQDEHRLTYVANIPVNWCEALGTVLANEEVDEWVQKGYTVERKPMRQWMMRITAYAQRLLDDLNTLDWPSSTIEMQRHWIGRSEGAEISFNVDGMSETIRVFTTRPDTIFGATYMVLAPEHELVAQLVQEEYASEIAAYVSSASLKSDLERTELSKEKTGVFTGSYAVNPASGRRMPIWIADYVLAHYGTGAIMAVPGHDQRDFEFATRYDLDIVQVVGPADISEHAFEDDGTSMNSESGDLSLNGLSTVNARREVTAWLERNGLGHAKVQFKLRDWLFSRQRYWGEPIPLLHFDDGTRRALTDDELPLRLPDVDQFQPAGTGESALATVPTWMDVIDQRTGNHGHYETNTMPQWAGSCWYYLRYCDPHNTAQFASKERLSYWLGDNGIDLYIGGAEHAVLHLLYARFWHKVLYDLGLVPTPEPVQRLFHQGLILGADGRKMSKSLGNVLSPDEVVDHVGADALRLYEMFMGPLEASSPWSMHGVEGISRFLDRVWRLVIDESGNVRSEIVDVEPTEDQDRVLHETIKKTREDIDNLSMNTSIAQFMIFVNEYTSTQDPLSRSAIERFLQCLAPFAPHITEEIWHRLGHSDSIHTSPFPEFDETRIARSTAEIVVQVNSKIRGHLVVPVHADEDAIVELVMADEKIVKHFDGKTIRKRIVVPGKLINFIIS
jgi:leucyl-tRNA synthetase